MERNQSGERSVQLTEISGAQKDVDRAALQLGNINRAVLRVLALSSPGKGGFADLENLREANYMHSELARDDVGWTRLGQGDTRGISDMNRVQAVRQSRIFARFDALCKQTVQLYKVYSVGDGIQWNIEDKEGQALLDGLTKSLANRRKFDAQGQGKTSDKLAVDGEVFWAIFLAPTIADSKLRQIDPLQITDIATDPEDEETPRYYKREWQRGGTNRIAWYRDYTNRKDEPGEDSRGKIIRGATSPALIYHTPLGGNGLRGEPLLTPILDEVEANRQFLRARLSIVLSLAQFAWTQKIKGGQAAVDAIVAARDSTLGDEGEETHPPAAYGSTNVENMGSTLTPIRQETGAASAEVDGRMFLQRLGAGVCVYPHYYGDGPAFRLATATAMELPMHKNFFAFRRLQWDMYGGLFRFLFEEAGIENPYIDPEQPPIVPKDVGKLIHAIAEAAEKWPQLILADEVQKLILTYIGIDGVDEVHDRIKKQREEPPTEAQMTEMLTSIARNLKRVVELQEGRS